jgi:hypothetical protein
MNFAGLIYLVLAHYLSGKGVLKLFNVQLPALPAACLSFILGVPLLSFAPCALQLMSIPITEISVITSVFIFSAVFSAPLLIKYKRPQIIKLAMPDPAEWPFMIVLGFFIIMSLWRCFYLPPFSRDMLSGPELLAKYAIEEKTMISSVFTIDLSSSNNYFKSPYITCLQIIYKLLVTPFGQLWLSVLFVPFTVWIYSLIRSTLHPIIAGLLMVFFITIPELYAYTYLILYDYSNMIFFFCGFYFLVRYLDTKRINDFVFSAFLFGLATYIRTETLILLALIGPLLLYHFYKGRFKPAKTALFVGGFYLIPVAFYVLNIDVFVRHFVPMPFDLKGNINPDLGNISAFFTRLRDINMELIFSNVGIGVYGYFVYLFLGVLVLNLVWIRRFNRESLLALYGIGVVYFGLGLVGYLLPLADLMNTTKRGIFKALPLMLWYMGNSGPLLCLSAWITKVTGPKEQLTSTARNKTTPQVEPKLAPKVVPKAQNKKR